MDVMLTCDLNIHGIAFRIKTCSARVAVIREMFGLFLNKIDSGAAIDIDWMDESNLDFTLPLARRGLFAIHAGAFVNKRGTGILLPGDGGSGKSTIILSGLKLNLKIAGDDIILFRKDGNRMRFLPYFSRMVLKRSKRLEIYDILRRHRRDIFTDIYPNVIVFPSITDKMRSKLEAINTRKNIFLQLLKSVVWVNDKKIREEEISMLKELCLIPSYRLILGKDHSRKPEIALKLLEEL